MDDGRLYLQLQKLARAGRFSYSFSQDSFEISQDLNLLLGRPPRTEVMSLEVFCQDHIFHEDQDLFKSTLLDSRDPGLFQPRPFRIHLPSGLSFWFKAWGETDPQDSEPRISGFFMDITPEKELESSLRLQQTNLRSIFESSPIPLALVSRDGSKYILANHLFLEVLEYHESGFYRMIPLEWIARDQDKTDILEQLEITGVLRGKEVEIRTRTERSGWALLSATLTNFFGSDAYLIGFADIGRQKETEAQLLGTNSFLETLLNETPDPVVYTQGDGSVAGTNRGFHDLLDPGNLLAPGTNLLEFFPELQGMAQEDKAKEIRRGEGAQTRTFLISQGLYNARDGQGGRIYLFKDVSALKVAQEAAEASGRAKSEFIANMSHEFRTPLNIVTGFSEMLASTQLDERQRRWVESIQSGAKNLLLLINDILDLSKIESGSLKVVPEFINLEELVRDVLSIFSLKVEEKSLWLRFEPEISKNILVELDSVRIRQILFNLVGNAVKFTHEGGVTLGVRGTFHPGGRVDIHLGVKDTGVGIPTEAQAHIFESFRQQDHTISRTYGGTGLGLAITRRLADLMGGTIELHSTPGEGSLFTLVLPRLHYREGTPGSILDKESSADPGVSPEVLGVPQDLRPVLSRMLQSVGNSGNVSAISKFAETVQTQAIDCGARELELWAQELKRCCTDFNLEGMVRLLDRLRQGVNHQEAEYGKS